MPKDRVRILALRTRPSISNMQATLQIIGSAFAAGIAWVILEFCGRPLRKFFDLRGEVIRRLIEFANVRARLREVRDDPGMTEQIDLDDEELKRLEQAQQTFRDLAAQMHAFSQNETFARYLAQKLRYDPKRAAEALIGLSNSYDTYGNSKRFHRKRLYEALRIKSGPGDVA